MSGKTSIVIEGMNCGHCSHAVKNLIEEVEGVVSAEVNLGTKEASVSFNPNSTSAQAIIENINSSETYKASLK